MIDSPPSSRLPPTNETGVGVDGRSKIIANVLPASGRKDASAPLTRAALIAAALSRMPRSCPVESSSRSGKCLGWGLTVASMALSVDRYSEALFARFASRVEPPYAFGQLLVRDHEGRPARPDIVAG